MDLREGRGDRDGEAQKAPHLHGPPEQPVQRLAAGVLEHQHGPTAFADELERSHRPRPVQLVLQSVFVSKAIEGGRRRMLGGGQHGQHGGLTTVSVLTPLQKTRSPSSHNTVRLVAPAAPGDEEKFIWRTPRSRQWRNSAYEVSGAPWRGLQIGFRYRVTTTRPLTRKMCGGRAMKSTSESNVLQPHAGIHLVALP